LIIAAIEGAGCRWLILLPYSPNFSPIELVFAKLQAARRKAAGRARPAARFPRHSSYLLPQ
jgi:hypothetical protein